MMRVHTYLSKTDTARAIVRRLLALIDVADKPYFHLALSGGTTPAHMFDVWVDEFAAQTPWKRLRLYWVDERCVPPTDAESNYGMTKKHLLDKVAMPSEQVFRIYGEADAQAEAVRYARMVAQSGMPMQDGFPIFDAILLGAGDDGHTSSIFPDRMELLQSPHSYVVAVHPTSGQKRIALTGEPIVRSPHVLFLMTGEGKRPVLHDMQSSADTGPAAYVVHHAKHEVEVFTDLG